MSRASSISRDFSSTFWTLPASKKYTLSIVSLLFVNVIPSGILLDFNTISKVNKLVIPLIKEFQVISKNRDFAKKTNEISFFSVWYLIAILVDFVKDFLLVDDLDVVTWQTVHFRFFRLPSLDHFHTQCVCSSLRSLYTSLLAPTSPNN